MARPRKPPRTPGGPTSIPAPMPSSPYRPGTRAPGGGVVMPDGTIKKPKKQPPAGAPAPTSSDPYVAPDGINVGGLSVNGVPPVVPTLYDQWLTNYQPYQNTVGGIVGQRTAEIGNMGAQIARALGLFGATDGVDLAKWLGGTGGFSEQILSSINADANGDGIPDWQNAATQATSGGVSTLAQLQNAQTQRQTALENDLAARGIYRSGELGYQTDQNNTQRTRDEYAARQQFIDYVTGLSSAFAQNEANRGAGLNQAANDAYAYYNDPNNQIPGAAGMQGAVGAGDPTGPAPAWTPPADPGAPPQTPAAQANAARKKAALQAQQAANQQAANAAARAARDAARAQAPRKPKKKRPPETYGDTIVVV